MIFGTSLVGAFLVVRAAAIYLGDFPDISVLFRELRTGNKIVADLNFFLYLFAIMALFVVGSMKQIKDKEKDELKRMEEFKKV